LKENTLTISDEELGRLTELVYIALLVDLVRLLVVDKQRSGTLAIHPLFIHTLGRFLLEWLLSQNSN